MRCLLILLLALCAAAADPAPTTLPASSQKLIDDALVAAGKLEEVRQQGLAKEQAKLVAALQKEQEKYTKKGDLDSALAVKAAIEKVQAGMLQRPGAASADLLGDGEPPAAARPGEPVAAILATACPIQPAAAGQDEGPAPYARLMGRTVKIALPKGEPNRYAFTCRVPGTVLVCTGSNDRLNAELWQSLQQAGFKRLETPERHAWFAMDMTPGAQFVLQDTAAPAQVVLYAGGIRPTR